MPKELAIKSATGQITYTRDQIELLKRTVCKGASDDELRLFLHIAERTRLDPFARQIHAVKRWDASVKTTVMTPQTGIDGYRLIAERTGKYIPGPEPTFLLQDGADHPISATATVRKNVDREWFDVTATARYDEYVQTRYVKNAKGEYVNDAKGERLKEPTEMWKTKPYLMLGKCAEALALRKAFPADLSGVYTEDEMPASTMAMPIGGESAPASDRPSGSDRLINENELKLLHAKIDHFGFKKEDVKAYAKKAWGKESSKDLTVTELSGLLKWMEFGDDPPAALEGGVQ